MKKKKKYNYYPLIRNAHRKIWLQSPMRREAVARATVRETVLKKDGTPAKRKKIVGYKCEKCGKILEKKELNVHHTQGATTNIFEMVLDEYLKILFCPASDLMVLCKACHHDEHKGDK